MGLFEKKSTFRKFIDSITNAIYDNPDLGPEFMEELEEGLVMSDIGIDTSDAIMKELDVMSDEVVYVGDTGVDMETGKAFGANRTVGVLWGFRKREELERAGADRIIFAPSELLTEVE